MQVGTQPTCFQTRFNRKWCVLRTNFVVYFRLIFSLFFFLDRHALAYRPDNEFSNRRNRPPNRSRTKTRILFCRNFNRQISFPRYLCRRIAQDFKVMVQQVTELNLTLTAHDSIKLKLYRAAEESQFHRFTRRSFLFLAILRWQSSCNALSRRSACIRAHHLGVNMPRYDYREPCPTFFASHLEQHAQVAEIFLQSFDIAEWSVELAALSSCVESSPLCSSNLLRVHPRAYFFSIK